MSAPIMMCSGPMTGPPPQGTHRSTPGRAATSQSLFEGLLFYNVVADLADRITICLPCRDGKRSAQFEHTLLVTEVRKHDQNDH